MATHSTVFAWEIPWTEETGRLQSMGSQKSWTPLTDRTCTHAQVLLKAKHFPFAEIGVNLASFFFFPFLSPCWLLIVKMSAGALAISTQPSFRQEEKEKMERKRVDSPAESVFLRDFPVTPTNDFCLLSFLILTGE